MRARSFRSAFGGACALAAELFLSSSPARADELRAHATLGVAHALSAPQSDEFGWGGNASVSLELPLSAKVGVEGKLGALFLAHGDAPSNPAFAPRKAGIALLETIGLRVRPFTEVAGPWASAGLGLSETGNLVRFGVDGAIGWDFRLSRTSRWDLGPVVEYMQVVQPDDSIRPEDARVLSVGLHLGLGVAAKPPPRTDRDQDGIFDDEDACPEVSGIRTNDPKTNGCPRPDRDHDGVFDDEDACPEVSGIRTSDPKTNGCPRGDRDHDGIFDDEDACPDVAGVHTDDPKTNGCPRGDRDHDGIFDDEDACPDIAGVRSDDPETNGCPSDKTIHMERDRLMLDDVILFDLDSPRVHHASWPVVKKLAEFILRTPEIVELSIEGHTDATGDEKHNLALSRARAESVRKLLIKYGVEPDRIKAEAFGRSRLKVQTNRPEQKNRRVEFWITRVRPQEVPAGTTPAQGNQGTKVEPGDTKR